jgi:histidine triad (HIT) family protein
MFSHAPKDYICPFCLLTQGGESKYNSQQDIIYQDRFVVAFISPRWWPNNPGNVIVIPGSHFENIYDLPSEYAHCIQDIAREVAIAMKIVYKCAGVSTRQHNEPAGGQDVWHYHLHVFPRYKDDNLYQSLPLPEYVPNEKRRVYADRLRKYLSNRLSIQER